MATTSGARVNRPMDVKQKEADVNRKLQIYGIVSAFQNGKVPSNEQIDVALNSFIASPALSKPSDKLSSEGRALINDTKHVINQAKLLLLSKNEGNLLQDFIYQTTQFDPNAVNTPNAPVDKDTAKQHGDQALQGLRTLGTLIITNGQFRKLLSDATILLRDMAGDAATKAADKVRPAREDLDQIDRPAEDNTWHDAPDFSRDNLKQQAQGLYKGDLRQDAKDIAGAATQSAHPQGSNDPAGAARAAAQDQVQGTNSGVDAKGGLNRAAEVARDRLNQNVPDEHKDRANNLKDAANAKTNEYQDRLKDYLKRKMPEDRRDQAIWRLKKMVIECQQHPDYHQAIDTLLDLAEQYGGHANKIAQGGNDTVQQTRTHLAQAESDLKTLIERFANGTSTDDLWESVNQIYTDADRDPELKGWFEATDKYIRRCLKEQGYILSDDATDQWNRLYDQGNFLLRDKYRGHTDRVVDEINFLADQFNQDPQNTAFGNSVQKLFTDLGNDENGKPTFKPHLVKDLTEVIIPSILENISYIPVPRIEYSDHQIDAIVENLVLESDNFMPNVLEIASENFLRWGRKNIANRTTMAVDVKVAGIQLDLRDVSYYVKRKQGFPSLTDEGVANILVAGDGFTFRIKMSTAEEKDRQNFFKVDKVDVDVKNMNIKLIKSKHKLLFNLFKPMLLNVVRPALQKAAEKAIKDNVHKLDSLLWQVKLEADRALNEAQENPENVPNLYNRYATAAQKKFLQGKQKAQEATADKKVNYAITKEDSMFPNIHLPGGISSKATEYKELARKGDKWESPVFSIGEAQRSSDIPAAPKVVRKPHETRQPKDVQNYRRDVGTAGGAGQAGGFNGSAGYGSNAGGYGGNGSVAPDYGYPAGQTSAYGGGGVGGTAAGGYSGSGVGGTAGGAYGVPGTTV